MIDNPGVRPEHLAPTPSTLSRAEMADAFACGVRALRDAIEDQDEEAIEGVLAELNDLFAWAMVSTWPLDPPEEPLALH